MIKLLHAADLHLDSAFSSLSPALSVQRRQEQRQCLRLLAQAAQDCDLVLLAGDLFDSAHVYRDTLDALKECFAAISAPIFIAPGNHDYLAAGSPYLTEDWGSNVHIFTESAVRRVHLDALHCDVYGAAFTAPEMPSLPEGFRAEKTDGVSLMVLHSDLQPNSPYLPLTGAQIAASGLDYLALGHVHLQQVHRFGSTVCAYSGCMMGRGFDECGQKGVLKVELSENDCRTQFVPIHSRKYEILSVAAGDDPLAAIRAALPPQTADDCYRILLTGESDAVDVAALEQALSPSFFSVSVRDRTVPRQSLWAAGDEDTLRGHFLRNLKQQLDHADTQEEQQRIILAAKLTLALMDGREVPL